MDAVVNSFRAADVVARHPKWANVLLVIALGWALAVLTLKFLPKSEINYRSSSLATSVNTTNNSSDPLEQANLTAGLHLFGVVDADRPPLPPQPPGPLPQTTLNFKLTGIFAYTPTERAIAIISEGAGDQSAFGIGDQLLNGVTLVEVFKDHVIINNAGKLEKLSLSEGPTATTVRPTTQVPIKPTQALQQTAAIDLPTTPTELRQLFIEKPSLLGRVVATAPYQENGKLIGYQITPKQNPEILEAQGIYGGDVITSVNGIALNSQKQAMRALRNAVRAPTLELVLLRDGVEVAATISLTQ